jgi:Rad3-related DNA helicase
VLLLCVLQINASDAILIFDEAHNIEDQARCALQCQAT